jgi:UDP-N-acetylmuramyl pentapeptide synthase
MSARLIPNEIVRSTDGRLACGSALTMLNGVCFNLQDVSSGCLFVPLKTDSHDGHLDIDTALSKGAGGALCECTSGKLTSLVKKWPLKIIVEVNDAHESLLNLACFWRHKIMAHAVIGTPGSEPALNLAAVMLKEKKNPLYLQAKKNMLHETALDLLSLNAHHGWVLIEMKQDCPETAKQLCEMCMPSIAVVTDDTPCARALIESLETPGVILIPDDKTFPADYSPRDGVRLIPCNAASGPGIETSLPEDGLAALSRMCMAVALAKHLGLKPDEIQAGLNAL